MIKGEKQMRYHAKELRYDRVTIFGKEAFFACERIQRDSVPEGLYQYEVRHDDEGRGVPVQIARGILVNFYGSLLCRENLEDEETHPYIDFSEDDWCWISDQCVTLDELLKKEE